MMPSLLVQFTINRVLVGKIDLRTHLRRDPSIALLKLNKRACSQCFHKSRELVLEKIFRGFQCHVSRADEKQFPRPPLEKMRVVEIGILCHDNPFLLDGNFIERPIPGKVPAFKIRGVHRIVSRRLKNLLQGGGEMSVDEEFHAATKRWLFSFKERVA